jgi:hypothetical protein
MQFEVNSLVTFLIQAGVLSMILGEKYSALKYLTNFPGSLGSAYQ